MRTGSASGQPRQLSPDDVPDLLRPNMRVFVQGLASETALFHQALQARPESASGVHFCGALIPGINEFDYASLTPTAELTGLFLMPAYAASMAQGRVHHLPMHYSDAYRWFASQHFDLVVLHVAPPDEQGLCSLGVNADFAQAALAHATSVLAYVNHDMPRTAGSAVEWRRLSAVVETAQPLPSFFASDGRPDDITLRIARRIADLVRDGDCLQLGIGKIPAAVLGFLQGHRDLGMHSGLVTDAAVDLITRGVITGSRNKLHPGKITTNALVGTPRLYSIAQEPCFSMQNVSFTHSALTLAQIPQLLSINSAVEVDLLGQVNSETINGRPISSVGGAVDFIRGATLSPGGRAIIALPSTTPRGHSRIVTRLGAGSPVTIARADTPVIVTEHGVADLRGCTASERARRLIAIADPAARAALEAGALEAGSRGGSLSIAQ